MEWDKVRFDSSSIWQKNDERGLFDDQLSWSFRFVEIVCSSLFCRKLTGINRFSLTSMVRLFFQKLFVAYPNGAALVLRLGFGFMMGVNHGYVKLMHFHEWKTDFTRFMGLDGSLSLALAIFAEGVCSILLVLGLFTRLALLPLLIAMAVIFQSHNWDFLGEGEPATSFLIGYLAILTLGPGRYSLDWLIGNRLKMRES